jgi:hypothetical protein
LPGVLATLILGQGLALSAAEPSPAVEIYDYRVDWRFWHAGDIRLIYRPPGRAPGDLRQGEVTLKTRGFVDSLYHVDNQYTVLYDDGFCASSSLFEVSEGKKRRRIGVTYQEPPGMVSYLDRDLVKNRVAQRKLLSVPPCVHDELAALARLRSMPARPGDTFELPVSNGKKSIVVRVEVQQRETVKTPAGVFEAIRYEAFLFNNVLYRRQGHLWFWLTDDERRLPVQFRISLRVYFGTITLQLIRKEI